MARNRKRTGGTWSALCRILLLVAFLVQSNLVQAHAHAAQPAALAAVQDETGHPDDTSDYCFLCWEAAVAGQYIAPPAIVLPPPPQPERWVSEQRVSEFALGKVSLGWLSRAPPQ